MSQKRPLGPAWGVTLGKHTHRPQTLTRLLENANQTILQFESERARVYCRNVKKIMSGVDFTPSGWIVVEPY